MEGIAEVMVIAESNSNGERPVPAMTITIKYYFICPVFGHTPCDEKTTGCPGAARCGLTHRIMFRKNVF